MKNLSTILCGMLGIAVVLGGVFALPLASALYDDSGRGAAVVHAQSSTGFNFPSQIVDCGTDVTSYTKTTTGERCTKGMCTTCDLVKTAKKIIDLLISVGLVVAVLLFLNAGLLYVTAGGSPGSISRAHRIFFSTLIGLVITLSAWLLIDTVMKVVYRESDQNWGPWNDILCDGITGNEVCVAPRAPLPPDPAAALQRSVQNAPRDIAGRPMTSAVVPIPGDVPVKDGACGGDACATNATMAHSLATLNADLSAVSIRWRVTEACPPTVTVQHQNSCHAACTCVDANFTSGATPSNVKYFIEAAKNRGIKATYEVPTQAQADNLISEGVPASDVLVVTRLYGVPPKPIVPHFSLELQTLPPARNQTRDGVPVEPTAQPTTEPSTQPSTQPTSPSANPTSPTTRPSDDVAPMGS